jgi:hypothetical protein
MFYATKKEKWLDGIDCSSQWHSKKGLATDLLGDQNKMNTTDKV